MPSQYYSKYQQLTIEYPSTMEQLQVFATTPFYTNVAMNRATMSATELQERVLHCLNQGITMFAFLKADGTTIRRAVGTLNPSLIPPKILELGVDTIHGNLQYLVQIGKKLASGEEIDEPFKTLIIAMADKTAAFLKPKDKKEKKPSPDTQTFFDMEAQQWRSYKIDNLLCLVLPNVEPEGE